MLSDGACPAPGSGGSRAQPRQDRKQPPNLWEEGTVEVFGEEGEVDRVGRKINSNHFSRTCNPPNTPIPWLRPMSQVSQLRPREA